LILSSGSFSTKNAPVTSIDVSVEFDGYMKLYQQVQHSLTPVSENEFDYLRKNFPGIVRKDDSGLLERAMLEKYSQYNWDISSPNLKQLYNQLDNATANRTLSISFSITRDSSSNNQLITSYDVGITPEKQLELSNAIKKTQQGSTPDLVQIDELVPTFVRLPGVTGEVEFTGKKVTAYLSYIVDSSDEMVVDSVKVINYSKYWQLTDQNGNPINFVVIDAVMPIGISSSLASIGIIGLYATYVVMVFGIVRDMLSGSPSDIPYEHMNDVDDLLTLCEDLLLARQLKDLVLEEQIFCELIEIFRSTDKIIDATKEKPFTSIAVKRKDVFDELEEAKDENIPEVKPEDEKERDDHSESVNYSSSDEKEKLE